LNLRAAGVLLFLFIPLVLVLYLRMPLGPAASLGLGVAIMIGHRFVARPWFLAHLADRCFWCGAPRAGAASPFSSKGEAIAARACGEDHAGRILAFARLVARARLPLAILILVPVAAYLVNGLASVAGLPSVGWEAARWGFKVPIAAAVVTLSFAWPAGRRLTSPPAVDFPVHNLFLLGIGNTLWVFRVVGLWWLVEAAWTLSRT
jgi:hypothetical protein